MRSGHRGAAQTILMASNTLSAKTLIRRLWHKTTCIALAQCAREPSLSRMMHRRHYLEGGDLKHTSRVQSTWGFAVALPVALPTNIAQCSTWELFKASPFVRARTSHDLNALSPSMDRPPRRHSVSNFLRQSRVIRAPCTSRFRGREHQTCSHREHCIPHLI